MLKDSRIAFIGSGAMGEAIMAGLLARDLVLPGQIIAGDPVAARREQMQAVYGVQTTARNLEAVADADVVVLAVKPQIFPKVTPELSGQIPPGALVLSIMAGVSLQAMQSALRHDRIVRSIPNTPAQVGKGMTVWTALADVSAPQREQTVAILEALGEQIAVDDERYLDMATGLSGSGPGFVFLLIEALIDAGVQIGFSRAHAQQMVLQTIDGSIELMRSSGLHPAELRNRVTSPGGTTAAGLFEMEAGGVRPIMARAVAAAFQRSVELGEPKKKQD